MGAAVSAAAKLSAPQAVCKKTAAKRQIRAAPRPPHTPKKKILTRTHLAPRRDAGPEVKLARRDETRRDAPRRPKLTRPYETPPPPSIKLTLRAETPKRRRRTHPLHSRTGIQTVGNTQKITEAMRLVAAAKVRRAQEAVLQTRPFSETLQSVFLGLIDQLGKEPIDIPLLETREVKKVTLLAMSGDRGLCGSYNTYIIKKTEARKEELEAQGIEVEIVPVGTKVAGYFRRRGVEFPSEYNCPQVPTAEFAAAVSSEMLNKFLDGETDKVELIYTQFVSLIASAPKLKTLLPLSKTGLEAAEDEMFELTTEDGELAVETTPLDAPEAKEFPKDTIFEQDPIAILNGILPLYLDGQILRSLQEAVASELASRMQSMQSASDNAKDLKKSLSQTYNRIRQAGVTQEILEIVAGASASE